ncbi:Small GTP-binding protein [Oopsacas minuta]|uniref:Small GTP-binding protein n=1 Tax=Oopsacas minuta TaxID=111878 RepID=A0AAV7KKZ9_9METZ|nr:Small GTP-binding protein [Oopsacas minuta]
MSSTSTNKVTLIGESGVGKTSLCHRFLFGTFPDYTSETITASVNEKIYHSPRGHSIAVTFQDTQGFESCGSLLPPSLCRNTNVILLVYSLDDEDSIKTLYTLGDSILKYMPTARKIVVGNKYDIMNLNPRIDNLISGNKDLSDVDHTIKVSARTGQGIGELETMITSLIGNYKTSEFTFNTSVKLDDVTNDPLDHKGCCKNI